MNEKEAEDGPLFQKIIKNKYLVFIKYNIKWSLVASLW